MSSIGELGKRVESVFEELSELDVKDFAQLEREVRRAFLRLAGQAIEALCADFGKGYAGAWRECGCGGRARYEGDRQRTVVTICGAVSIARAYYRCPTCGKAEHPLDGQLGLSGGWSPGMRELVSLVGANWSYGRSADLVERMTGVRVSATSVQSLTEQEGERAIKEMRQGGPMSSSAASIPTSAQAEEGATGRVYLDGVMTPLRGRWAEAKVGLVCGEGGHRRYITHLGSPEPVGRMLRRAARRLDIRSSKQVVVMGDGAPWIWKQAEVNFPGALQIVDWYHGCQQIHGTALGLCGEGSPRGHAWAKRMRDVLWNQGGAGLVASLKRSPYRRRKPVKDLARYVRRNAHRMDYPRWRRMGLEMGSGPVESACKQVVQARLKQAGMRWTAQDAQKIMALRCIYLSDLWDSFWSRRAA